MSRRANLPGAAELFRVTDPRPAEPATTGPGDGSGRAAGTGTARTDDPPAPVPLRGVPAAPQTTAATDDAGAGPRRQPSGRQRHDEKITVYISAEELHELEHARLVLRRLHGVRADRGRLVREALAVVLSDLEAHGEDSILVRRFREQ